MRKFRQRFGYIERRLAERGKAPKDATIEEMEALWQEAKRVIEVRQLFELRIVRQRLRLQKMIWGFDDMELLPLRFRGGGQQVGGHVFGAFDGEQMVGFCFAIPGVKPVGGRICTATCSGCCRSIATRASEGS